MRLFHNYWNFFNPKLTELYLSNLSTNVNLNNAETILSVMHNYTLMYFIQYTYWLNYYFLYCKIACINKLCAYFLNFIFYISNLLNFMQKIFFLYFYNHSGYKSENRSMKNISLIFLMKLPSFNYWCTLLKESMYISQYITWSV